jgi:hypothetical protein
MICCRLWFAQVVLFRVLLLYPLLNQNFGVAFPAAHVPICRSFRDYIGLLVPTPVVWILTTAVSPPLNYQLWLIVPLLIDLPCAFRTVDDYSDL